VINNKKDVSLSFNGAKILIEDFCKTMVLG
jgi:hypothetical protein